ncbi:MAG: hypothetical protein LIO69_03145 [Oscillospiraceae bacterium]|nr:hypothetical protein [Oscillospiraceae bacterium]
MTLLVTVFAAAAATIAWYTSPKARRLKVSALCYMYWGAALMWLVDAAFEYASMGAELFTPPLSDMLNDLFLGLSAVVLGIVIWTAIVLIKDPLGTVKSAFSKGNKI